MAGICFEGHVSWRVHCSTQATQMVAHSTLDRSVILHIGWRVLRDAGGI